MSKSGRASVLGALMWLSIAAVCSGAIIWARPTASVTNEFSTGFVDIELEQYGVDEPERNINGEPVVTILPGMDIPRTTRIHNRGNECYVRAKVMFRGTECLDESCIYGVDGNWIRAADGYHYYRDILAEGGSVDLFEGLFIPETFCQGEEGREITLEVQVDAIQSRNVTPDPEAEEPWGNVEILSAVNAREGVIRVLRTVSDRKFVVEYQGEVSEMIVNEENFFGNLPDLLPGDEYTDGAKLINNGDRPIRLYFRSVVQDETDITDKICLMIETETEGASKVVYEGALRAEALSEDILLMTIPANGIGKMVFSVYVPDELDNSYALKDEAVRWIFSTEEILLPGEAADTGDDRRVGGYLVLAGLSLGFAVRMIQRRRGRDGATA